MLLLETWLFIIERIDNNTSEKKHIEIDAEE